MIRLKVFVPLLLVAVLASLFVLFRFDALLKVWIENGISNFTETKTDIGDLHISFKDSSLTIGRMEIASKDDEFKNLVEFADIVIDFQTLPLLKKRFIVD